jgi:hypothetical protein
VLLLLLLVAGTGVGLYFLAPDLLYRTVPWVEQVVPRPTSTTPALTLRSFETTVEVTVPSETSETAILAALREEFARQAKAQFGEATIVNTSSASTIGGFERIDGGNGQSIIRATMRGFIQAP